jgi:uncharacterized protein
LRLIPRDSLTPMPWKNGGGITREIACFPAGSDTASFDWRISTAEVATDGPFSRFEGIDRRLYLLEGAGLDLRIGTDGPKRLWPGEHADFAGEAPVDARLVDGAVSDLNIMVRRNRLQAHFMAATVSGRAAIDLPWETAVLFVQEGEMSVAGVSPGVARRFDTVLLAPGHVRTLTVSGTATLLLIGFSAAA